MPGDIPEELEERLWEISEDLNEARATSMADLRVRAENVLEWIGGPSQEFIGPDGDPTAEWRAGHWDVFDRAAYALAKDVLRLLDMRAA